MSKAPAAASGARSSKLLFRIKAMLLLKIVDRQLEKERKKDVPHPCMPFDDKTQVEKAKKRAVVNQTEARNRVELFRCLPQFEHGTQLPDLVKVFPT